MTAPGTLSAALVRAAGTSRGLVAIEHDGRSSRIGYNTLLDCALAGAATLAALGLEPGERVALVVPEVAPFVEAFFSILAAGLVPVPLAPPTQAGNVTAFGRHTGLLLSASRASALVTTDDLAPLVGGVECEPGAGPAVTNGRGGRMAQAATQIVLVRSLSGHGTMPAPIDVRPHQPGLIQFTSGSTAAPKGVVLSHANLVANVQAIAGPDGIAVAPNDVGVSWLPLYHDMGLIGMLLTAVYCGNDVVIMSPVHFLKRPTAWLEAISKYKGSVSFAPNFAYELCLKRVKPSQIEALDLSTWRIAGCGAEPIRADTLLAFADRFASAGFRASSFVPSYGLAEHALAVTMARGGLRVDRADAMRLGRESVAVWAQNGTPAVQVVECGAPFPGHAVRIVDDAGRELPERNVGRIMARGPSLMVGYFEDPEATAQVLRDGWLDTGDLGYRANGSLFVCGRTKDVIIRHGRKYHPPDLESAIADVDGLRSSAVVVVGIARADDADEVVAVVEARASAASDDVVDSVRRRVRETAGFELDRVVVTPPGTIPRTTSGKVRRAEMRERLVAGTLLVAEREVPV